MKFQRKKHYRIISILSALSALLVLIVASSQASASFLWQQLIDPIDDPYDGEHSVSVVANEDMTFVATVVPGNSEQPDWFVNSFDLQTGEPIWSDEFDLDGQTDQIQMLALNGNRLIATGWSKDEQGQAFRVVRAYAADTGELLWQYEDGFDGAIVSTSQMLATEQYVVIAGSERETVFTTAGRDWQLYVLNIQDGSVVWKEELNPDDNLDQASQLSIQGNHLFVSGTISYADGQMNVLRSYNLHTGALFWEEGQTDYSGTNFVTANNVIFWAGQYNGGDKSVGAVRAYSAKNGRLLWEKLFDPDEEFTLSLNNISVEGNTIYIHGSLRKPLVDNKLFVASLKANNGRTNWSNVYTDEYSLNGIDMVVSDDAIFTSNLAVTYDSDYLWYIASFDKETGAFLWKDSTGFSIERDTPEDMIIQDDYLVVSGFGSESGVVRVYEIE